MNKSLRFTDLSIPGGTTNQRSEEEETTGKLKAVTMKLRLRQVNRHMGSAVCTAQRSGFWSVCIQMEDEEAQAESGEQLVGEGSYFLGVDERSEPRQHRTDKDKSTEWSIGRKQVRSGANRIIRGNPKSNPRRENSRIKQTTTHKVQTGSGSFNTWFSGRGQECR